MIFTVLAGIAEREPDNSRGTPSTDNAKHDDDAMADDTELRAVVSCALFARPEISGATLRTVINDRSVTTCDPVDGRDESSTVGAEFPSGNIDRNPANTIVGTSATSTKTTTGLNCP
jgi:hypothetical protein